MFPLIVTLLCTLGPPLIGLFKQAHDTKKLTRGQVVSGITKLAWEYVEGLKPGEFLNAVQSPAGARKVALDAAKRLAKSKGITLTAKEIEAAELGWELLSKAAKAIRK